jgi:heme/copper-type cytochrome/quinol oxidase subunit 1
MSFVGVMLFIFILWEALASQRSVVLSTHQGTSLEWQDQLPLDFHNMPETGLIVSHYKCKLK